MSVITHDLSNRGGWNERVAPVFCLAYAVDQSINVRPQYGLEPTKSQRFFLLDYAVAIAVVIRRIVATVHVDCAAHFSFKPTLRLVGVVASGVEKLVVKIERSLEASIANDTLPHLLPNVTNHECVGPVTVLELASKVGNTHLRLVPDAHKFFGVV